MATPPVPFRLAVAQIDVVVGDVGGNLERIRSTLAAAEESAPDLVVFPELAISGYPPEDLLLRPSFLDAARGTRRAGPGCRRGGRRGRFPAARCGRLQRRRGPTPRAGAARLPQAVPA